MFEGNGGKFLLIGGHIIMLVDDKFCHLRPGKKKQRTRLDGVKIAVSNTNDVQSLPSVLLVVLAEPEGNHCIKYKRYLVVADVRVLAEPEGDHCIKYE